MTKLAIIFLLHKVRYPMNLEIGHKIKTDHLRYNHYLLGNQ